MREDAGIILLNDKNEVLLQLRENRKDIEFPGTWVLFGGRIEKGEKPEEALKRELIEEIELKLGKIVFFGNYYYKDQRKQHIFFSRCNVNAAKIKLHEGADLRFFCRNELDWIRLGFNMKEVLKDFFTRLKK